MELNDKQFAAHLNNPNEGGASVNFHTRIPVQGRGFMTAFSGAEQSTSLPATAEQIGSYRTKHAAKVEGNDAAVHGAWKNPETPGTYDQDVSVQVKTPKESQKMGVAEVQKAAYALPHTAVNRKGAKVGKYGGDVLFHTADLGKNDVDPNYRPGALDMKGGKGSFTKNQYQNKDWNKVGGTHNGKDVTYGQVLRKINENRTERLRGTGN
jgi:hypothetical protein